jgi:hypothetical protein
MPSTQLPGTGTPKPDKNVRNEADDDPSDEALHKERMKLLCFGMCESRQGTLSISHRSPPADWPFGRYRANPSRQGILHQQQAWLAYRW